ncbi:YciI family protein [Nocardiopsis sp. EMB25]|uniref:YciI family protein n=1 Tax=Nocardiopsis TaxID=2013 RepID=UPI00034C6F7C|nr:MULTISPECIES: YciI family protein [Nocardiopsis]MCY9784320.1 YciI family protein [Nocardiopsis sp. EMB25]
MYIVLLRLSANGSAAADHMEAHREWIRQGMEDGVFLLAGSIEPGRGGALLATGTTEEDLQARVAKDPFVINDVVTAEVLEVSPGVTDPRLAFLKD